jgi:hypothetical protein
VHTTVCDLTARHSIVQTWSDLKEQYVCNLNKHSLYPDDIHYNDTNIRMCCNVARSYFAAYHASEVITAPVARKNEKFHASDSVIVQLSHPVRPEIIVRHVDRLCICHTSIRLVAASESDADCTYAIISHIVRQYASLGERKSPSSYLLGGWWACCRSWDLQKRWLREPLLRVLLGRHRIRM